MQEGHDKSLEYLPDRFIDYFVVFGVLPSSQIDELELEKLNRKEIEERLASMNLRAGIVERFPIQDYPDLKVQDMLTTVMAKA